MNSTNPRRTTGTIAAGIASLVLVAAAEPVIAQASQAGSPKQAETFTGTTVNLAPGAGENLSIHVLRWSSDDERGRLASAFMDKGDAGLQAVFEATPSHGIMWTNESLGYSLRFAHRAVLPDGGERIIVATDRRLGTWSAGDVWKPAGQTAPTNYPFTVVELRLNRQGQGDGKMSLAAKVIFDQDARTLALQNYGAGPILIKDVRRARSTSSN
jgi:hypothetical protein